MSDIDQKRDELQRHKENVEKDPDGFHALADMDAWRTLTSFADLGSFHNAIVDATEPGESLLDVCAGTGQQGSTAAERTKADYYAIEIAQNQINHGRSNVPGGWVQGDAECLPFEDNSFVTVIASAALHHLPKWRTTALPEIARVLKSGGTFVFRDPLLHNPFMGMYRLLFEHRERTDAETPLDYRELQNTIGEHFDNLKIRSFFIISPILPIIAKQFPITIPDSVLRGTVKAERIILDNGGGILGAEVVGVAENAN